MKLDWLPLDRVAVVGGGAGPLGGSLRECLRSALVVLLFTTRPELLPLMRSFGMGSSAGPLRMQLVVY